MNSQKILFVAAGLVAAFAAGFALANYGNRKELEGLRAELARARGGAATEQAGASAPGAQPSGPEASEREARELIARADANPSDPTAQRRAAERAYAHALMSGQPALLADAVRLLRRLHEANPADYDTLLLLANSHLTLGLSSDPKNFLDARGYYLKALQSRPDDVNLHTLLGMTYSYAEPPDPAAAAREYRKALARDPRHEMALQNLAAALVNTGELDEAARRVEELSAAHPANRSLPDLREKLSAARGGATGRGGAPGDSRTPTNPHGDATRAGATKAGAAKERR